MTMQAIGYDLRDYQIEAVEAIDEQWKLGVRSTMAVMPTGCHAKGQGILMFDGSIRRVEDIAEDDLLMGPDGSARRVLRLVRGVDDMFDIIPVKGKVWRVNGDHVLSLARCNTRSAVELRRRNLTERGTQPGEYVDVTVREWLTWSKTQKHIHKLVRVPVDFHVSQVPIDPWLLGVILGDGSIVNMPVTISKPDDEIFDGVSSIVGRYGCQANDVSQPGRCRTYSIVARDGKQNGLTKLLRELNLGGCRSGNKFIPSQYMTAVRHDRMQLLAGLIDTDGHLTASCYEYVTKSARLGLDVEFLSRSLGFAVSNAKSTKRCQNGFTGVYSRLCISGRVSEIPVRIPRKAASVRRQKKDVLRTGFKIVPSGTREEYFGFTVDSDNRYLLDDFTVTHNCGKTVVASSITERLWERHHAAEVDYTGATLFLAHREELIFQTRDKMQKQMPGARIVIEMADYKGYANLGRKPDIVIASTSSMLSRYKRYPKDYFGAAIVDEAQHCVGKSYTEPLGYFSDSIKHLLGLTATPKRLDGKAIGRLFDSVAFEMSIADAVDLGWILEPRNTIRNVREMDLRSVKVVAGDYQKSALSAEVSRTPVVRTVVAETVLIADGRQTAFYCVDVAHMRAVSAEILAQGHQCVMIDGKTHKTIRRARLMQFERRQVQFIVSCGTLTEGWDSPVCEVIAMLRPTQSAGLYTQICGRALRPISPPTQSTPEERRAWIAQSEKPYAEIIDFVGNRKHSLATMGDVLGGHFDEEIRRLAMDLAKHETGPFDMRELLKKAEEILEARRAQSQAIGNGRKKLKNALFNLKPHPYDVIGLDRKAAEITVSKDQSYDLREHSVQVLEDYKLHSHEIQRLSNKEQVHLARAMRQRSHDGLCTFAQARLLYRFGYEANVSCRIAGGLLDAVNGNDWWRPEVDGINERLLELVEAPENQWMRKYVNEEIARLDGGQQELPLQPTIQDDSSYSF